MRTFIMRFGWIFIMGWVLLVIALTALPGTSPLIRGVYQFYPATALAGAIGHTGLFASLVAVLYFATSRFLNWRLALIITVGIALSIAVFTEFRQMQLIARDADLLDLTANGLGIFAMGFLLSLLPRRTNPMIG